MRIGLAIDHFDPYRGGAEQWVFQHAAGLLARGHEVHVVAQQVSPAAEQIPIIPHRLGKIRSRIARAAAAEKQLRSLSLDVIHDMGMGWYSDILQSEDGSRLAQWAQRLKLLPTWARPWKQGMIRVLPRYRDFHKLMARQFGDPGRIIVAISKMCAHDYRRYHHVPPQRIRLVYHGTDHKRFSPAHRDRYRAQMRARLAIDDDDVMFMFIGHDYQRKGLRTALRAIGRLAAQRLPVRLVVVGGKHQTRYLQLAQQCGAAGHVRFAGSVKDPVPYYAAADALVLPTFYDPFGLVVLEAAACGLPVVTSALAGASELLTEGIDGYVLCDPADDEQLAARLRELLDPVLRRRMGEAARKLALKHTLARDCDQIVDIYHEIAGRQRFAA